MSPLLEVRDLSVSFAGPVLAVSGLSFSVAADEVLAVVGESGCGKTLTGLSILGLEPRGARVGGSVLFRDSDLRVAGPRRLREVRGAEIAMIFAEPMTALNPSLTVGYQMTEVLRRHLDLRGQAAKERAAELFDLVRMPSPGRQLHAYPHQLSGGMRQRVMIAMAVACSPALLIADEPTSALDVSVQAAILNQVADLHRELGFACLFISHDLAVVEYMCDRIAVMYLGTIVETGTRSQIFSAPRHPYTRALLSAALTPGSLPGGSPVPGGSVPAGPAVLRSTAETRLDGQRQDRRIVLTGELPDPRHPPSGCPFHTRCPVAQFPLCSEKSPDVVTIAEGHWARCHLAGAAVEA